MRTLVFFFIQNVRASLGLLSTKYWWKSVRGKGWRWTKSHFPAHKLKATTTARKKNGERIRKFSKWESLWKAHFSFGSGVTQTKVLWIFFFVRIYGMSCIEVREVGYIERERSISTAPFFSSYCGRKLCFIFERRSTMLDRDVKLKKKMVVIVWNVRSEKWVIRAEW